MLSHFNDVSCSLIDCCRFVYNVKCNILVWFDHYNLEQEIWNEAKSGLAERELRKARHAHKSLHGKNEGVQGGAEGGEGELWVNGCLFISRFPHPVSCKDGHSM